MRKESVEAALTLVWMRIGLRRRVRQVTRRESDEASRSDPPTPEQLATALDLGRNNQDVARKLPWTPSCLVQSLALRAMLRRRGILATIKFGVRKDRDTDGFAAHAWVACGDQVVLDSDVEQGYVTFERTSNGGER